LSFYSFSLYAGSPQTEHGDSSSHDGGKTRLDVPPLPWRIMLMDVLFAGYRVSFNPDCAIMIERIYKNCGWAVR
jgi:hypothetical protein